MNKKILVLKFPKTTPSGFITGIILMMVVLSKSSTSTESFGLDRYLKMPFTMKDATVSPGWIRDEIRITYLLVSSISGLVNVTIGIARPTKL